MKLSISTGNFSNISNKIEEKIACYKNTGFRYLDVSLYWDAKPDMPLGMDGEEWRRMFDAIGEEAAKLGLTIAMGHAPDGEYIKPGEERDMFIRAINRCIEGFASLGVSNLVLHPAWTPKFNQLQLHRENKAFYQNILPTAEAFGMNLLAENNLYTNGLLNTGRDLMEFIEAMDHPLIHACWDTGHARLVGADQYESIITLGDELRALHIQDNEGYWDRHTAPFFGTVNFDPVLQALVDIGYKGYFNFESGWVLMPRGRDEWIYNGEHVDKLATPPLHISQQVVRLVHEIGVHMLTSYGVYEES